MTHSAYRGVGETEVRLLLAELTASSRTRIFSWLIRRRLDLHLMDRPQSSLYTMRSEWTAYAAFSGVWLTLAGVAAFAATRHRQMWQLVGAELAIWLYYMLWASRFRVDYNGASLAYQTVWGVVTIPMSEIASVMAVSGYRPGTSVWRPKHRFEIVPHDATRYRAFDINAKVFAKADLIKLEKIFCDTGVLKY